MDVTPIITRLQAVLAGFVAISGAADAAVALDATPGVPAAYVVPLAETADPPELLGLYRQRVRQGFGVLIVVANLRDAKGAAAAADLQSRRLAVRAALCGWAPAPADGEPVIFNGGAIYQMDQQRLWWSDEFSVMTDYRSA